jgi:low temperature requirement protein LtrA
MSADRAFARRDDGGADRTAPADGRAALVRPPVLRAAAGEERHPTWLELFFDLCFVTAIAALAAGLHHDPTWHGVAVFGLLFVPVWWAWMGYTWYASAFDNDDVVFRLGMLGAMLLVIALAAGVTLVEDGSTAEFAVAYGLLQALLAGLFLRARRHATSARTFASRYALGDAVGAFVWFASLAVEEPWRYVVWALGMLVLMATPPWAVSGYEGKAFNADHIAERYGLFSLIVLGESVVAVAASLAGAGFDASAAATAALGFGIAACIWWTYFGSVRWASLTRQSLLRSFTWGYGHLFVFAGIAATSVGVHLAADAALAGHHLTFAERAIFAGGPAAYLAAITAVHLVTVLRWDRVVAARAVTAAAMGLLATAGGSLGPLGFSASLLAVMVALTVWETALGHRRPDVFGPESAAHTAGPVG